MIPSIRIVPARDINGPDARNFNSRDTIFVSPSGKDAYLGVSTAPVKTFSYAKQLLEQIKTSPDKERHLKLKSGIYKDKLSLTYSDNNIYNAPLYIERETTQSSKPVIEGSYYHTDDISVTDQGLLKIKLPSSLGYNSSEISMLIDNDRIFPARFPKKGVFYYAGDASDFPINRNFTINDRYSNFCISLSSLFTSNSNKNPRIVIGGDFNEDILQTTLVSISANNPLDTFNFTFVSDRNNVGISIIPFSQNSGGHNLSQIAHHFCTQPGEFVKSEEGSDVFVYVKPYNNTTSLFKILTSNETCIHLNGAENVYITDINIKHFNRGVLIDNYSRKAILSGCIIEKNVEGIRSENTANTTLYKNIIFDHSSNGSYNSIVSAFNCDNNIIMHNGLSRSLGVDVGGGATALTLVAPGGSRRNITDTPIISATSDSFTLPYDVNYFSAFSTFDGYLEVTSGPLIGQRRICTGNIGSGINWIRFKILDPWTPVGEYTTPQPGDTIKYVLSEGSSSVGYRCIRNKITNNYIKYSSYSVIHVTRGSADTLSGNYVSNGGYGFSNDMGGIYYGFGGGIDDTQRTKIYNNNISNVRQTPGKANGNGLYIDEQSRFITCNNNIVRKSSSSFCSNGSFQLNLYNNIFLDSLGMVKFERPIFNIQNNFRIHNVPALAQSTTAYGMSSFNNIFYATSGIMPVLYPEINSSIVPPPFFGNGNTQYATRIIHNNLNLDNNEYLSIGLVSSDDKTITGWNNSVFRYLRSGSRENRPIYEQTDQRCRFYVKDGNWVHAFFNQIEADRRTLFINASSDCGIEGYMYPWQVPSSAWFKVTTSNQLVVTPDPSTRYYPTINTSSILKRSAPIFNSYNNCFYTTLTSSNIPLENNRLSFRGSVVDDVSGRSFTVWSGLTGEASFSNSLCAYNSSTLVINPSSFESVYPFEGGSIFEDPKLNFNTYQVSEDSPVLDLGYQNIDINLTGIRSDGDENWLSIPTTLSANSIYGSSDWSEYLYGNHNEIDINI
jgi:hypothetical protein